MDEAACRLMEIAGHMDAITEQMKEDSESLIKAAILKHYAVEIDGLVFEMKKLLSLPPQ